MDAFDAERRRIERDLHDGAQQLLVALGITLGTAQPAPPEEVPQLLARAQEQARLTRDELRELIRDIHPKILTDRGLPAAVAELADRCPIPTEVDVRRPSRTTGGCWPCWPFCGVEHRQAAARSASRRRRAAVSVSERGGKGALGW